MIVVFEVHNLKLKLLPTFMTNFGCPYNDLVICRSLVICKNSTDYLSSTNYAALKELTLVVRVSGVPGSPKRTRRRLSGIPWSKKKFFFFSKCLMESRLAPLHLKVGSGID